MSIEQPKLINTHIEKTAGTSVRTLLQTAAGVDRMAIYDVGTNKLRLASEGSQRSVSPFINRLKSTLMDTPFYGGARELAHLLDKMRSKEELVEIPSDVLVIHGHFPADKYDDVVENPLRSIVFRDPLERMRSQYDHWTRNRGEADFRLPIVYDPEMSFEDYALLPELQNYQTQAVAGKPLTEFDAIGVTENLEPFRHDLVKLFVEQGWCDENILNTISLPRINQTSARTRSNPSQLQPSFLQAFRNFHSEDYQLHDAATRLLEK